MNDMLSSKTMKLVLITSLLIVGLVVFAALMTVAFGVQIPYVNEGLLALTGNSGIGAARNSYVDGPIRQQQAAAQLPPVAPPPA